MSSLSDMIKGEHPDGVKKMAHLVGFIKELGWDSLLDNKIIKPNLRRTQLYIRNNIQELHRLFQIIDIKDKNDVVDIINPLLIEHWHIQILGDTSSAYLQLLTK